MTYLRESSCEYETLRQGRQKHSNKQEIQIRSRMALPTGVPFRTIDRFKYKVHGRSADVYSQENTVFINQWCYRYVGFCLTRSHLDSQAYNSYVAYFARSVAETPTNVRRPILSIL